jgi:subtilisin-like proprotein convertase family protein
MQRSVWFFPSVWLLAAVFVATSVWLAAPALAGPATFSNPAPITINSATPPTKATPYPSPIVVSGVRGTITDVNVTLNAFNHTAPFDVDVLLVGPGGQSVILMSDAGVALALASGLTFTFDDEAAASLPESNALASGSFKPSNHPEVVACPEALNGMPDTFPDAPAAPYGSTLAAFDGTSANGTWSLYVVDDCAGDAGAFSGGWSLNITAEETETETPEQKITDLKAHVAGLGLAKGIATALNSKLEEALAALDADDAPGACGSLQAFLNQVAAQKAKKKLTGVQADELTAAANDIRTRLDC